MKIKQIEAILKKEKTIIVAETPYCQWFGNGSAFYPIYGLPKLTKENVFTLFDIVKDKRSEFRFEERPLPAYLNFENGDSSEQMLERSQITFIAEGRALEPLKTSKGIAFINSIYLKPFSNEPNGYELYERTDGNGCIYIAVKAGFILLGVIALYDLIGDKFIQTLETILELSRVAWFNKAQMRSDKAQMSMDDTDKDKEDGKQ